jgi:hypothetical protein
MNTVRTDRAMPPDAPVIELPPATENSLLRMGERVATLEERVRGIGASVDVIRATDHEINGHMQRFVIAEQECKNNLSALTSQIAKLTDAMIPLGDGVREFQRMHGELAEVLSGYERRRGVASFGKKLAAIVGCIGGLFTLLSGLVIGIFWMIQHIQVRP